MLAVLDSPSIRLAQEAERRRIARDLHDSVVQSLAALVADLEYYQTRHLPTQDQTGHTVAEKVASWQELARDSLTSLRQALGALRQPVELDFGLENAIQVVLSELRETGYTIVFESDNWPDQLPAEHTSQIYAVVREAVTNIDKHAHASTINLCMFSFEGHLHISVSDNGVGMKSQGAGSGMHSGHQQGLIGMRERMALLHGQLTIESVEGRGTRVDLDIPMIWFLGKHKAEKRIHDDGLTAREMEDQSP